MDTVELAHRADVELVNAGSWQLLSGSWHPNRKDILAAVEASKCPAVRRPKLKLGHLDSRFNEPEDPTFDGTPSLGWFDNLRSSNDGNTLIGDQVALPWLAKVQAAAYPDRSIEGKYNSRCALGHLHPFVVTAVSLLGETPPGIPTLKSIKSLSDLPAALGVAAAGEADPEGGESVQATIRAAADPEIPVHTGAMIALIPTAEDAERLAVDGGEPAPELHVTLAYLGEAADLSATVRQDVIDAVSSAVNGMPTVEADGFSLSAFNPGDVNDRDTCLVLGLSGDMLDAVHDMVDRALQGMDIAAQHRPWNAHTTLQYTDDLSKLAGLTDRIGPVVFDRVRIAFGGDVVDIPLIDDTPDDVGYGELEVPNILMPVAAASADKLRDYWVHGAGAKKIRWGEKNDFYRCVRQLGRFVSDPKGLCNTYHRAALGVAPGGEKVSAAEVKAGQHSLPDFDESKVKREDDGKFGRKWNADALKQDHRLGNDIALNPGESLAGGASIPSAGVAVAAVDSPDGRRLLLGLGLDSDEIKDWDGELKSVDLDDEGAGELRDAITAMFDAGKRGKAMSRDYEKRDDQLADREQQLVARQYPNLAEGDEGELAYVQGQLASNRKREADLTAEVQRYQQRLAEEDLPEPAVRLLGLNMRDTRDELDRLRTDITADQEWLTASTADPVSLSDADQAELDRVRADRAANQQAWVAHESGDKPVDSGLVFGEGNSIRWEVEMNDDGPIYSLGVKPYDAPYGWTLADADAEDGAQITPAALRKLAALLDKAGAPNNASDVLAGRHSLPDFEESKHKRANDGKFSTTWGGGGLKQDTKLGSRIKLGSGEKLAGGASIPRAGVVLAAIDSPDGRKLRVGLNINEEDTGRWSGADKGHTAVLDQAGVDGLRDAITHMQAGAVEGKAALKVFEKHETDLHKREQGLLGKQYPKLNAKQSRELGTVNRQLAVEQDRLQTYTSRQQARLDATPDETAREQAHALDAEITTARESGDRAAQADAEKRMRALLLEHGEYDDITAMMYARNNTQIADARTNVARLQARQAELTADPVDLSDTDRAELAQIRADLGRNDELWGEFNDGGHLAAGVIPAEWGDIRWAATMNSDEPVFSLAVVPAGEADTFVVPGGDDSIEAGDLTKLAALLDKVGAADVKAAADPAAPPESTTPAEPSALVLPAAEPEQVINPDPKEGPVPTDLSAYRSRLGLPDDADDAAITAALDAKLDKADAPAEPTPEQVAASAAAAEAEAENARLGDKVEILSGLVKQQGEHLAAMNTEKATVVKASVIASAADQGKFTPAERETWEQRYDRSPEVTTEILASIPAYSAMPMVAAGAAGSAEPEVQTDGLGVSDTALNDWAKSLGISAEELTRG